MYENFLSLSQKVLALNLVLKGLSKLGNCFTVVLR